MRAIQLATEKGVEVIRPNPPVQFDIELRLTNRGPQDILVDHFGGLDLFGVAPAQLLPEMITSNVDSGLLFVDSDHARLRPQRIAVGRRLYFIIRTLDARPELWVSSPLSNVRIKRRRYRDKDAHPLGGFTLPGSSSWLRSRIRHY